MVNDEMGGVRKREVGGNGVRVAIVTASTFG